MQIVARLAKAALFPRVNKANDQKDSGADTNQCMHIGDKNECFVIALRQEAQPERVGDDRHEQQCHVRDVNLAEVLYLRLVELGPELRTQRASARYQEKNEVEGEAARLHHYAYSTSVLKNWLAIITNMDWCLIEHVQSIVARPVSIVFQRLMQDYIVVI